jgi:signal transduction histidine kinase
MKLFTNKDIRRFFLEVSAVLILLLLLSGLVLPGIIARDVKGRMLARDYGTAGYLLEHGAKPSDVAAAFAAVKNGREVSAGREFLQGLGYTAELDSRLTPDTNMLLSRYRLIFALSAVVFGIPILAAFFRYFRRQQYEIDRADACIRAFMDGDVSARMDSEKEGSLSALFAAINGMATSLKAHIDAERQTKEFLRETISNISHQLKTPLTALKMYNEIMREESANGDTVGRFCEKSAGALDRMEILIQNLLKIARLDAGTIILNKKEQNISELMQEIVSGFETRARQERKTISLDGAGSAVLYCDGDWIAEAVANLVKNALDHTKAGGQVKIAWRETPAIIKILVQDNGKGIHPEDIHHIFKRFYRSRFSQDTQGIGLGLSLAKAIVEAHNGTITAESTLGEGSVFILDFLKLTEL